MDKAFEIMMNTVPDQDKALELQAKLYEAASPKAVFGEPVEVGEYKIITASEVNIALGYGFGGGAEIKSKKSKSDAEDGEVRPSGGAGGGGGGGGAAASRPVAVIEIGPHGVRVEPIVDPTKIAIALFTTIISIMTMASKMKRGLRK